MHYNIKIDFQKSFFFGWKIFNCLLFEIFFIVNMKKSRLSCLLSEADNYELSNFDWYRPLSSVWRITKPSKPATTTRWVWMVWIEFRIFRFFFHYQIHHKMRQVCSTLSTEYHSCCQVQPKLQLLLGCAGIIIKIFNQHPAGHWNDHPSEKVWSCKKSASHWKYNLLVNMTRPQN